MHGALLFRMSLETVQEIGDFIKQKRLLKVRLRLSLSPHSPFLFAPRFTRCTPVLYPPFSSTLLLLHGKIHR